MDYETLILARQEYRELDEDGCIDTDNCSTCKLVSKCSDASKGLGEFPPCPYQQEEDV